MRTLTTSDGSTIAWDRLGDPRDPTLVLLGGAGWSMDWWEEDLCRDLAAHGRHVVRHDPRDTGGSTQWPVGAPAYGPEELAGDVLAVADAAGAQQVHLVGLSMGGGLAQSLAAHQPQRVLSLTLVASSPAWDGATGLADPTAGLVASWADAGEPDWSDPASVVEAVVAGERPYAGPDGWDEAQVRALAARVVARTPDMAASLTNHLVAIGRESRPVTHEALRGVPALVVHGSDDPLFPGHGRVLAEQLGAAYLELPGVGHQLPPPHLWPVLVDAVVAHTGEPRRLRSR